jgi:hypothetical protein
MQRKEEHERAKAYSQGAPNILVSHDSKIHGKGRGHPAKYYTCKNRFREHLGVAPSGAIHLLDTTPRLFTA